MTQVRWMMTWWRYKNLGAHSPLFALMIVVDETTVLSYALWHYGSSTHIFLYLIAMSRIVPLGIRTNHIEISYRIHNLLWNCRIWHFSDLNKGVGDAIYIIYSKFAICNVWQSSWLCTSKRKCVGSLLVNWDWVPATYSLVWRRFSYR